MNDINAHAAAESFIAKWRGITASVLSTSQSILIGLCKLLADLDESKYRVIWEPEMIVFTDGAKLELPADTGG